MTTSNRLTVENITGCRETRFALGTVITVLLPQIDTKSGRELLDNVFKEINRLERLLSVFIDTSDVWRLNNTGCCDGASSEILEVIKRAHFHSELSGGVFDITAGAHKPKKDITPDKKKHSSGGNYQNIIIEKDRIRLKQCGVKVNLGAIGKGYIVDRAIDYLSNKGVQSAMVNAGGDLRVIGEIRNGHCWRVGIRNPFKPRKMISSTLLHDQAVATSGSYRRPIHDIYNPQTGKESYGIASASVVTDSAMDADALATSVYILGTEKGKSLIGAWAGASTLCVLADGELIEFGDWHQTGMDVMPLLNNT
ncbi:MAG: FAD:protein FMN transferase [Desulfobacterium sp.]